ncbi:hypothetical protein E3E31_10590 [Thermococcus sp. M39]|uniref:hypothetical protein n=1 Tax=unclassified Thermococcus TaxID=2627626 RepID=UPI0014388ECB|nr:MULTISPECIES: hypothetical protein [unclassified Thermococcus]NJE08961.1 hypothetical protein [Thermococcus sp. M39]NJE12765.1 hypothetical protein [Thermococcus sp. LS2]
MLRSKNKAQTALEMMFIAGIILLGIALVVPSYFEENKVTSVVTYVRASASRACDYLNMGVFTDDPRYSVLNPALERLNGVNPNLRVLRLETSQLNNTITITVVLTTPYSAIDNETLASAIESFIVHDLSTTTNLALSNGTLVYGDTIVNIAVRVER